MRVVVGDKIGNCYLVARIDRYKVASDQPKLFYVLVDRYGVRKFFRILYFVGNLYFDKDSSSFLTYHKSVADRYFGFFAVYFSRIFDGKFAYTALVSDIGYYKRTCDFRRKRNLLFFGNFYRRSDYFEFATYARVRTRIGFTRITQTVITDFGRRELCSVFGKQRSNVNPVFTVEFFEFCGSGIFVSRNGHRIWISDYAVKHVFEVVTAEHKSAVIDYTVGEVSHYIVADFGNHEFAYRTHTLDSEHYFARSEPCEIGIIVFFVIEIHSEIFSVAVSVLQSDVNAVFCVIVRKPTRIERFFFIERIIKRGQKVLRPCYNRALLGRIVGVTAFRAHKAYFYKRSAQSRIALYLSGVALG